VFDGDVAKRNFFFKEMLSGLTSTLTKVVRTKVKPQFSDLMRELPVPLAHILANNIYDAEVLDAMAPMFDYSCKLY
jgi:hypothetical protein